MHVVGMVMPKDVLIYGPQDYVILHGNGDYADMIKLRILRWGDDPESSKQAPKNHQGFCKTEAGVTE